MDEMYLILKYTLYYRLSIDSSGGNKNKLLVWSTILIKIIIIEIF